MKADAFNPENLAAATRRGQNLEYLTIGWNSLEAVAAIGAGLLAGSIALVGFGFDSVIESLSGAVLLWRTTRTTCASTGRSQFSHTYRLCRF